jgi:hypothetical protein
MLGSVAYGRILCFVIWMEIPEFVSHLQVTGAFSGLEKRQASQIAIKHGVFCCICSAARISRSLLFLNNMPMT